MVKIVEEKCAPYFNFFEIFFRYSVGSDELKWQVQQEKQDRISNDKLNG